MLNGRGDLLDVHVCNYRQAHDVRMEYSSKIQCDIPRIEERVEFLIHSINYADRTLQDAMSLVRANNSKTREDFEATHSSFAEADPYHRSIISPDWNANFSSINFKAGQGSSGVDLRFHPRKDFLKLTQNQRNDLQN